MARLIAALVLLALSVATAYVALWRFVNRQWIYFAIDVTTTGINMAAGAILLAAWWEDWRANRSF